MNTSVSTPKGEINIRTAIETEAVDYRELRLEALKKYPQFFGSDYQTYAEKPLQYWVERLRVFGENSILFFAEHGNEFIGMGGVYRETTPKEHHTATIVSLYVKEEWRGLHIAEALIQRLIQWALDHGISIVKLGVVSTNTAAVRCYERLGFIEYGLEPKALYYEGQMYDMRLMFKEIE